MSFASAGGVSKWSQVAIDVDKDMQGYGLTNVKQVAAAMAGGDLIAKGLGGILVRIPAGVANQVLTSMGPGELPVWAPGGLYLNRYFPSNVELYVAATKTLVRNNQHGIAKTWGSIYTGVIGDSTADKLKMQLAELGMSITKSKTPVYDYSQSKTSIVNISYDLDTVLDSAQAEDGGAFTDETDDSKSGFFLGQNYTINDDNFKTPTVTAWEAQTFTTTVKQSIRYVYLKLYCVPSGMVIPGVVTLSIRGTTASLPAGADLATATLTNEIGTYDTNGAWYKFTFATPITLEAATQYALVLRNTSGLASLRWRSDNTTPTYAGGGRCFSNNSGTDWTSDATADLLFAVWSTEFTPDMTLFPAAIASNDAYNFGHAKKFNALIVDVNIAGAGTYTYIWEYSLGGGNWAACVDLDDDSDGFKNQWLQTISHTPQADWALETINGVEAYYIRCRCTDTGAGYTQPLGNFARALIKGG